MIARVKPSIVKPGSFNMTMFPPYCIVDHSIFGSQNYPCDFFLLPKLKALQHFDTIKNIIKAVKNKLKKISY